MKIGIRATLQALLEADDLIAGKTLGESALALVRRYRTALESARTMRNGIERLKHELAEAQQSETKALARLDGAIAATDNLRAQIAAITAERDDTEAARVMAVQGRNRVTERAENEATIRQSYKVGDTVPWDLVAAAKEDGCLWIKNFGGLPFVMGLRGTFSVVIGAEDPDIEHFLAGGHPSPPTAISLEQPRTATLIARNLGSNPEQWRDAMQQHLMQKGT